jgi:hypothetical protein
MFGLVYTVPAFVFAIRPEFKAYCLGKPGAGAPGLEDASDDISDPWR